MIDFNTKNIIIVYFPRYAGGKFLINCLAMSRHAVFSRSRLAEAEFPDLLAHFDPKNLYDALILERMNRDYYNEFKLGFALETLPKNPDLIKYWTSYEYGCEQLYGTAIRNFQTLSMQDFKKQEFNNIISRLSHSDKRFFLIAHTASEVPVMLKIWPNAQVVKLSNFSRFQELASKLKTAKVATTKNMVLDIPHLDFDVESYYSRAKFLSELNGLYQSLEFKDFPESQIATFWKQYTALHGIG